MSTLSGRLLSEFDPTIFTYSLGENTARLKIE